MWFVLSSAALAKLLAYFIAHCLLLTEIADSSREASRLAFEKKGAEVTSRWIEMVHNRSENISEKEDKKAVNRSEWGKFIHHQVPSSKAIWWSRTCYGYSSPWAKCARKCYTERYFFLVEGRGCPVETYQNLSRSVKICTGGDCPLVRDGKNPFMSNARAAMFDFEFHNQIVEHLTDFMTSMQLPIHFMLLFTICVVARVQHFELRWLPDIDVAVPVAAICVSSARWGAFHGVNFAPVMDESFAAAISTLMNHVLLPITIFTGAYTVQRKNLFAEFPSALVLAVVGTSSQIGLVGVMVKKSGDLGWHTVDNWRESFAYASFVADVDPVTTLSIFANLKVPPLLQTLAAGEGLLNDPIALVVFGMLNKAQDELDLDVIGGLYSIASELVFSILLGLFVGFFLIKIMSVCHVPGKGPLESIFVLSSSYVAYSFGEAVGLSGIIVCLFAGFVMGIFVGDMVDDAKEVESFLHVSAHMAELTMFFLVGFGVFLLDDWSDVPLGALTVPICIIARGITVSVLVAILNFFKGRYGGLKIDAATAFMLFQSNLRGGITLMMALQLDASWSRHQDHILGSTIIAMIGLNYLGGVTGPYFMRLVGLPLDVPQVDGGLWDPETDVARAFHLLRQPLGSWLGRRASIDNSSSQLEEWKRRVTIRRNRRLHSGKQPDASTVQDGSIELGVMNRSASDAASVHEEPLLNDVQLESAPENTSPVPVHYVLSGSSENSSEPDVTRPSVISCSLSEEALLDDVQPAFSTSFTVDPQRMQEAQLDDVQLAIGETFSTVGGASTTEPAAASTTMETLSTFEVDPQRMQDCGPFVSFTPHVDGSNEPS